MDCEKQGFEDVSKGKKLPKYRRNNTRCVFYDDKLQNTIFKRFQDTLPQTVKYRKSMWKLHGLHPKLSVMRYTMNQKFKQHLDAQFENDIVIENQNVRTFNGISCCLYLNTVPKKCGGLTRFIVKGKYIPIQPIEGTALLFDPKDAVHDAQVLSFNGEENQYKVSEKDRNTPLKYMLRADVLYSKI